VAADALVPRLAELSSDQWGDVYAFTWGVLTRGASLPLRFIDGLGRMTEGFMARLRGSPEARRPAVPDPPDGWYDSLDPALLVRHWLASRQPDYRSTDILQTYDEHGIRVGHLALDRTTMVAIRLAQHGSPHRLIDLVHLPRDGEAKSWLHTVVPLAVRLGDERHPFRHVKAGPVFGEIAAGDHVYLLAAVSSLLVIVEVHGERARIVWGGRAEKLPEVVIEPRLALHPVSRSRRPSSPSSSDASRRRRRCSPPNVGPARTIGAATRPMRRARGRPRINSRAPCTSSPSCRPSSAPRSRSAWRPRSSA
jgi:hypothetical protein